MSKLLESTEPVFSKMCWFLEVSVFTSSALHLHLKEDAAHLLHGSVLTGPAFSQFLSSAHGYCLPVRRVGGFSSEPLLQFVLPGMWETLRVNWLHSPAIQGTQG